MSRLAQHMKAVGVVLAVLLTPLLSGVISAQAYATPVLSAPTEGEVVRKVPAYVMIAFSEPVDPFASQIEVFDANGRKVDRNDCGIDVADPSRKTMISTLQPDLAPGVYTVHWTTVADSDSQAEGYTIKGQFEFTLAPPLYQVVLTGVAAVLGFLFVTGGWVGFGLTLRRLRRLEAALAERPSAPLT